MPTVLKVPGAVFTTPIPPIDEILHAGSLVLIDPTHPHEQWAAGIPTAVPNIASAEVAALGLTPTAAGVQNTFATATAGKAERTAKGGLHGIASQTAGVTGQLLRVNLPEEIRAYIQANPTHSYYMSLWRTFTRSAGTSTSIPFARLWGTTNTSLGHLSQTSTAITGNPTSADTRRLGLTAGVAAAGRSAFGFVGQALTTSETLRNLWINVGPINTSSTSDTNASRPSIALYRAYLEDLTVSGRTFAQVDAIDNTLAAAAFGGGGRYAADTYTNPTTIP